MNFRSFLRWLEDTGPAAGMAPPGNTTDSSATIGRTNMAGIRSNITTTNEFPKPKRKPNPKDKTTPESIFGVQQKVFNTNQIKDDQGRVS